MKQVIDADGLILGRMASIVAKKLLLGDQVEVVNAEKAVIVGKKDDIISNYKAKVKKGHPYSGPFVPRPPHLLIKRTVRGMLPKNTRGRELLKNLKVHIGNPVGKAEKLSCHVSKSGYWKYLTVGDLSVMLGAKKRW